MGFFAWTSVFGEPWAPDTTDLISWAELRNGYTTDVGVTSVPDLGSAGGAMAQTTDTDEPAESTLGTEAQPAALTDGSDDFLLHTAAAANFAPLHNGTGSTLYLIVNEPIAPDTAGQVFGTHRGSAPASHTGFDLFRNLGNWIVRITNASGTYVLNVSTAMASGAALYVVRFQTGIGPADEFEIRRNGAVAYSAATVTGAPAAGAPDSPPIVGESFGTGNNLGMKYGGHLVYGARHDDVTVEAYEAGLNGAYGLWS